MNVMRVVTIFGVKCLHGEQRDSGEVSGHETTWTGDRDSEALLTQLHNGV